MMKAGDGNYYEMNSNAISDMLEPGSTFKTASLRSPAVTTVKKDRISHLLSRPSLSLSMNLGKLP